MSADSLKSETVSLTRAELRALWKSAPARTRYRLTVEPQLPIKHEPGRCFPGYSSARVTRAEFLRVGLDLLSETMESRGAMLRVRIITDTDYRCLYL